MSKCKCISGDSRGSGDRLVGGGEEVGGGWGGAGETVFSLKNISSFILI